MKEIIVNDNNTILSEFKIERVYEWDDATKTNYLVHKTFISMIGLSKDKSDEMKKIIQGDSPSKEFGRFGYFYITLYGVSLSSWKYEARRNCLRINFTPLDGFGYLSGMGLNVLRDQKLNQILNF